MKQLKNVETVIWQHTDKGYHFNWAKINSKIKVEFGFVYDVH